VSSARCPGWRPILGGGLVDAFGWRSVFWINLPVVAVAIVGAALFVPDSRAPRARRLDPVGQVLTALVLGCVVYAIIESTSLGWTSPVIVGLLAVAALGVAGILGYEPRRADPLLELRLFRSVPFAAAIVMALFALCGFGAFLFVTTQYLQDVRGLPPVTAGLCLLPVGLPVLLVSLLAGRIVGGRGPRPLASTGRQAGTTLGVAISGTVIGPAAAPGGSAFTNAAHGVWWMILALGVGVAALGLVSTGRWASRTALRAAALFEWVDAPVRDQSP